MISSDVRRAIARAIADEGLAPADPGLRPAAAPGQYASNVAFASGEQPHSVATRVAARLAAAAGATAALSEDVERSLSSPPPDELAVVGEATVRYSAEKDGAAESRLPQETELARAVAYAGADAVRFALARALPGRPVGIDGQIIARHVLGNPAYAVRYAHARAASGVRWAANSRPSTLGRPAVPRHPLAHQAELVLLDALSWLPERVAVAARRGRPDEFARYLEELASATIAALICVGYPANARVPGTDRLSMAKAARTGLAAGLGLLGVGAPDRL